MPLTEKGHKILAAMKKHYGVKKGKQVFYASQNKGTITGTHKKRRLARAMKRRRRRAA
jgi:hypothetical protein